jgi:hypothetical protein
MNSSVKTWLCFAGAISLFICIAGCSDAGISPGNPRSELNGNKFENKESEAGPIVTEDAVRQTAQIMVTRNRYADSVAGAKERWANWVRRHPFANRSSEFIQGVDKIPKRDRPDLAAEHDFLMTVDPALRSVPRERLFVADEQAKTIAMNAAIAGINWTERGRTDPGDGLRSERWNQ